MMIKKLFSTSVNTLSHISPPLAGKFAFYVFSTPLKKFKLPAFEVEQFLKAEKDYIVVDGLKIATYCWGNGQKPVLFAHGWNSRATRCAKMIPPLLQQGYSVIAFDAQGHGNSEGKRTNILDYSKIILALSKQYGVFEAIISHSFGTICTFQALKDGAAAKCLISLNGVAEFSYMAEKFCALLELNPRVKTHLRSHTERAFSTRDDIWTRFSVVHEAHKINLPILVFSDESDPLVNKSQAEKIYTVYGEQVKIFETKNLGHHRAVTDPGVIERVVEFIGDG